MNNLKHGDKLKFISDEDKANFIISHESNYLLIELFMDDDDGLFHVDCVDDDGDVWLDADNVWIYHGDLQYFEKV